MKEVLILTLLTGLGISLSMALIAWFAERGSPPRRRGGISETSRHWLAVNLLIGSSSPERPAHLLDVVLSIYPEMRLDLEHDAARLNDELLHAVT